MITSVPDYVERQQVRETFSRTLRFDWDFEKDQGRTEIFRMLSWPQDSHRFSYPTYVEEKSDSGEVSFRQGSAQFNLSFALTFDPKVGLKNYDNETKTRGEWEKKMVEFFQFAFQLEKEAAIKRLMDVQGYTQAAAESETERFTLTPKGIPHWVFWGKKSPVYGVQVIQDGGVISECELRPQTISPWCSYQGKPSNQLGKDPEGNWVIERGLNQLVKLTAGGNLIYPPFLSKVKITAKRTYFDKKDNYLAYEPELICNEAFMNQLPAHFHPCVWVHPEDAEAVSKYYSSENRGEPIDYRDYPDENGGLVFVAIRTGDTHAFSCVFDDDLTPELVKRIADRPSSHSYKPSTDLSLIGGFYYTDSHDNWTPISVEDSLNLITGKFDEANNPVVSVNGFETTIRYADGKLWRSPLYLRYTNKEHDPVLKNFQEIESKAKVLGLPVWSKEFEKPQVLDLKHLWEQSKAPATTHNTTQQTVSAAPQQTISVDEI